MVKLKEPNKDSKAETKQNNYLFHVYDATTGDIALKVNNLNCSNEYNKKKPDAD